MATSIEGENSTEGTDTPVQNAEELQAVKQQTGVDTADQAVIDQIRTIALPLCNNDPERMSNILQAAATEEMVVNPTQ